VTKNLPANIPSAVAVLTSKLAARFEMGDVDTTELVNTLKQTAFKGQNGEPPTDAQMTALLIVADQYGLNPWLKEIHAFPAKGGGIVPIVGVDGWSNIINNHPQMDGMEFEINWDKGDEHITCVIWRKDRNRPIKVTEYLEECIRGTEPWKMRRRMLRHKAMIQCGRVAFGYGGLHDPDEAQDILNNEKFMGAAEVVAPGQQPQPAASAGIASEIVMEAWPDDKLQARFDGWREAIAKGKTPDDIINWAQSKGTLTDAQKEKIRALAKPAGSDPAVPAVTYAVLATSLEKATTPEELGEAGDLIQHIPDAQQRAELQTIYDRREAELA
jgi:phage recombination protein Bet